MRLILYPIGALIIRIKSRNFSKPIENKYSSQDIVNEAAQFLIILTMIGFLGYLIYRIIFD